MICPYCNRENRPTAKICGYCGRALSQVPSHGAAPSYPPASRTEQMGLGPKNVRIIGGSLIALLVISGIVYILFLQGGNPLAASATPTPRGGRTPTGLAAGSPISSAGVALSPVPGAAVPASTPVLTAAVTRRLDIAGSSRNAVNVTDVGANSSTKLFTASGAISGMILSAAWSPDGKKILLSYYWNSSNSDYGHVVSICNEDGTGVSEIVRTAPSTQGLNAALAYRDAIWSPDGTRIAVRFQYGNDFGIWLGNADGTGLKRLAASDIGDWPRYWSVDGKWIIGVSSADGTMYGVSVEGIERVPFATLKGIKMYDERYFPWRVTDDPKCNVSGSWFTTGGAYWDCD